MGPNNKKRSRKNYVKYRLMVLDELGIERPDKKTIERLLDEEKTSDGLVDAIFFEIIKNAD